MKRSLLPVLGGVALAALVTLTACDDAAPQAVKAPAMNQRAAKPPEGPGRRGEICVIVRNRAPFTITGRLELKSRERTGFRLSRGKTRKFCLSGQLYGQNTASFVITNYLTIPLFSCYTTGGRSVDVYATRHREGWIYQATCR